MMEKKQLRSIFFLYRSFHDIIIIHMNISWDQLESVVEMYQPGVRRGKIP